MRRLKVLISAYACEPGRGSEPGVGWNMAREVADHHEVWVLTRANNRLMIEAELARSPVPGLSFIYYDLPPWARWWKRGKRGIQLYYQLWQVGAYGVARRLHHKVGFDLIHHVTFVNYWKPSLLSLTGIPFMWGPVGGGESAPRSFWHDFSHRGKAYETLRDLGRLVGEFNPLVRTTARRSALALATTEETAARLPRLGAKNVKILSQIALNEEEIERLQRYAAPPKEPMRFASVGSLLHLKGTHLGLRAFARACLQGADYWIIGAGPERKRLQALAAKLGIAQHVKFWGRLPRDEALRRLGECHVLVHPSLHDSGGLVCLEAMAESIPVICLDLGGPAVQVTAETGIKVSAISPDQAVEELAAAMRTLLEDDGLRIRMGQAAQRRVVEHFNWSKKGAQIARLYREILVQ
jgi:glycosyltransferase involved in cell wall biosynthesis